MTDERRILFVDDDPNILSAYKRRLRKQFHIETALSGDAGLKTIDDQGPFAVIVADMRMPGMDGVQFLAKARKRSPGSVRMMLTGNADLQTAINAANEGNVFRFLAKPCSPEDFAKSLDAGLKQHQLINVEQELITKTVVGSVRILTEILGLASPIAFSRASHVARYVKLIAAKLNLPNLWQLEMAGLLSQIGCVSLPSEVIENVYEGKPLSLKEQKMYTSHPAIGAEIITNIPRLELVARMIEKQQKPFREYTQSERIAEEGVISLGAQILKVAIGFDKILARGHPHEKALTRLRDRPSEYNQKIVDALESCQMPEAQPLNQDASNAEDSDNRGDDDRG